MRGIPIGNSFLLFTFDGKYQIDDVYLIILLSQK
jgi:hypothetical protein